MPPIQAPASATRFGAGHRALPNQLALVSGKAGQHGQHQAARGGGGIELLRHAADADAVFLEFGDRVQNQPGFSAQLSSL